MQAENGVHMGVLEAAEGDHFLRAEVQLLRGLEQELDAAVEVLAHGSEDFRGAEQGAVVGVVAAGVHDARVLRGVGGGGLLQDGQGVDVGAQADAGAVAAAAEQTDDAGLQAFDLHHFDIKGAERLLDVGGGVEFPEAQLRVFMAVPEDVIEFLLHFFHQMPDGHRIVFCQKKGLLLCSFPLI